MAEIGKINTLKVIKEVDFGVYLDGGDHDEILLPKRYVPENCQPDDEIDVFIYLDSEDRIIASTEFPTAVVGEFAYLKAIAVNNTGAFLDWGLPKDLLVPFREQKQKMEEGKSYLVYIYLDDESERIAASSKLDKYLDNVEPEYEVNQEVDLIIAQETNIGFKAIVDNLHWGLLYKNEVYKNISIGDHLKGYIKKVREDEKIDVSLEKPGFEKSEKLFDEILQALKNNGGFLPIGDKTSPELIKEMFNTSKKSFKKAIGAMYKKKMIKITPKGISLFEKN